MNVEAVEKSRSLFGRSHAVVSIRYSLLGDKGETVSRLTVINDRETYSIVFSIGPGERADHLSLHACKHVFRKAIASIDGTQVFDVPIRQKDIAQLFGGPLRLGHDFVIWGYDCD